MTQPPRVALLIESSRSYGRGILRGVARYSHIHGPWSIFYRERDIYSEMPAWLKTWEGDGVIARIHGRSMARSLARLKIPVVDVLGKDKYEGIPGFDTDADAVARTAADFFLKAGFVNIAYCGFSGLPFSSRRRTALEEYLAKHNRKLLVCLPAPSKCGSNYLLEIEESGMAAEREIADWIKRQPQPLAMLACNDVRAQQILDACRSHGLKVPEQVSVIGVDNDDVLCNLCEPALTSIQPDTERLGFEAADLLARLMQGESTPAQIRQIPPLGITERHSTDVVAVADPIVIEALRFIRSRLTQGIAVKDVLEAVHRSRTDLENRFRRHLKISIKGELQRQRMDRACNLLIQTDLPITEVAARSGFNTNTHFCRLFREIMRTTPTNYRRAGNFEYKAPV